ncbi:MAG TPA: polysaccharide deacetylase family protein [Azospira sp.]|nr:polysaccharide deacetylase family protein [Azospira sp.]
MPQLALKIDVDTFRGTRIGVPRLVELLQKHGAQATFLFSLGPDNTGRAIKRAFRPGFMKKVKRTSVVEHYGLLTLMYGTVLPAPDIGKRCAQILRSVKEAGFETGIHCWDHVLWQDNVEKANNEWVEVEMAKAAKRYEDIFGERPSTHGAAGWQMNRHALRLTQRLGLAYASDSRGTGPFIPVIDGEIVACPQLPTTLPTLDELIGVDDITADNVAAHLLSLTADAPASGHVYTLHAELEGMKLLPVFEQLLEGWKAQGYDLVSTRQMLDGLNKAALPRCEMLRGEIPGRSGSLMLQGPQFLGC